MPQTFDALLMSLALVESSGECISPCLVFRVPIEPIGHEVAGLIVHHLQLVVLNLVGSAVVKACHKQLVQGGRTFRSRHRAPTGCSLALCAPEYLHDRHTALNQIHFFTTRRLHASANRTRIPEEIGSLDSSFFLQPNPSYRSLDAKRTSCIDYSEAIVYDLEETRFIVHDMTLQRSSRSRNRGPYFFFLSFSVKIGTS
jgi:hypothetical protein